MSDTHENNGKIMANALKIKLFKNGKTDPEMKIRIPVATFRIAWKLFPVKVKAILENEGIDLAGFCEFFLGAPPPKGLLIEIEDGRDKLAISSE